jgi:hypothetical protein
LVVEVSTPKKQSIDLAALDLEVATMQKVARILKDLNPGARVRVMWWCLTVFCPHVPPDWVDKVITWGIPSDDHTW